MAKKFLRLLKRNQINFFGPTLKQKVVVFESDDWGAIRTPSLEVFETLVRKGFPLQQSHFNRLDSLESNDDLSLLIDLLKSYTNGQGENPKFTLNTIVANPDFAKIAESDFGDYYYEPLTATLEGYPNSDRILQLFNQGRDQKVFRNQFHGREHLNIQRWMRAIRDKSNPARTTFLYRTTYAGNGDYSFMEAFDFDTTTELASHNETVRTGIEIFRHLFDCLPNSFVAPCMVWDSSLEQILSAHGVRYLQADLHQLAPQGGLNNYKKVPIRLGERKSSGMLQLRRNCTFEPFLTSKTDWVDHALAGIAAAFRWHKPAVICSHRVNYVGTLSPANRERGLRELRRLLSEILKNWPDVSFLFSDELGKLLET